MGQSLPLPITKPYLTTNELVLLMIIFIVGWQALNLVFLSNKYSRMRFRKLMGQHIGLLLKRLGLIMAIYTGFRLVFFVLNHHQFVNHDLVDIGFSFVHGLRFDLSSILITNIFFILFSILPGNFKYKFGYQSFLKFFIYSI